MKIVSINRSTVNAAESVGLAHFDEAHAKRALDFHSTFPQYQPTPLHSLDALAQAIGLKKIFVKDESYRFGLNAFKVLGSSYAVARILSFRFGSNILSFDQLTDGRLEPNMFTFTTTTDGNHGRGLAWTARQLNQKAVIYMPRGTKRERFENIAKENAEVSITKMNYDDTVRFTREQAKLNGWTLVQDTTMDRYAIMPRLIMQGYLTMAREIFEQLSDQLSEPPTHVFLQAGVGSMAGSIAAFLTNVYGINRPKVIIVEPYEADCIYQTALANDGKVHATSGRLNTMMAGLACGEPCQLAWDLLSETADYALVCGDQVSARAMKLLANPLDNDDKIISGESGAVGVGVTLDLMTRSDCRAIRDQLGLDENSVVVCISTEGDTDRENYEKIVRG